MTVALPLTNETAISGWVTVALSPLCGCVRAALDDEPILCNVRADGLLDAAATPADAIETASAHPVKAARRCRERDDIGSFPQEIEIDRPPRAIVLTHPLARVCR